MNKNLKKLKHMDWFMTIAICILLVIGILFVYSSCYISDEQPVRTLYKKQIVWAFAGILCYLLFATTNYQILNKIALWVYGAVILLLVMVMFIGTRIYGAKRWLMLFGMGIQPSEFAKIAIIMLLSSKLSRPGVDFSRFSSLIKILFLVAVPVLLIIKEPDLGTAIIFLPMAFIMMFAGGFPLRVLGYILLICLIVVGVLLGVLFLPEKIGVSEASQDKIVKMTGLSEYQKNRIKVFLGLDNDPIGAGWNKIQSKIAVGSGGKWGKGFKNGTQNMLGFLPRSVAPTDFIYSVIAEEKGFLGSVTVLLLFCIVVIRGISTSLKARDNLGRLLCVGCISMIFCHVFVNIAMTIGLMPITGLPLPLLSYGGSFMVVMMSALGIVQSVHIHSYPKTGEWR